MKKKKRKEKTTQAMEKSVFFRLEVGARILRGRPLAANIQIKSRGGHGSRRRCKWLASGHLRARKRLRQAVGLLRAAPALQRAAGRMAADRAEWLRIGIDILIISMICAKIEQRMRMQSKKIL